LVFISDNFVLGKLDDLAPNHHEAVEGFFDASQERADNTSFEGYESLERGSERPLIGVTAKSAGRALADASPSPISSHMKMKTPVSSSGGFGSYVQLQREIHDALREQHPEWIEANGDCPTCESYESRFAELLELFQLHERNSAA
jgi:hypothetical protein